MQLGTLSKLALASTFAFLSGCGPHWTVVRQATPNPMTVQSPFFVSAVSLEGLAVGDKSEGEWMADKSAETRDKWEGDKVAMNEKFSEGFDAARGDVARVGAPNGAFILRAHFDRYEPGFYAGIVNGNARIDATVDILAPNGAVLDEFRVHSEASGFSAGERARSCARTIGWIAAKYVRNRVGD